MQVTITAMNKTPRISKKTGKAFVSLGIKTDQHGDAWLSGFAGKENEAWAVGDTVEIDIQQKGEYLNFSVPKKEDKGPAASGAGTAELKNILMFKIIPMLEAIYKEVHTEKPAPHNTDPDAIDRAFGGPTEEDSPF